jgi:hypothetical protein
MVEVQFFWVPLSSERIRALAAETRSVCIPTEDRGNEGNGEQNLIAPGSYFSRNPKHFHSVIHFGPSPSVR